MNRAQLEVQTEELLDSFYDVVTNVLDFAKEPSISAEPSTKICVQKQLKDLENGLDEAEFLALLLKYLNDMESKHQALLQENEMLRVELTHIHELLKIDDQQDIDELKRQKQFDNEMRALDEQLSSDFEFGSGDVINSLEPETETTIDMNESPVIDANCPHMLTKVVIKYFAQYTNAGRYDIAVPLCQSVIKEMKPCNPSDRLDLAALMQILAVNYRNESRFGRSAYVMKSVLNIYDETLSEENPLILTTLQNLSYLYVMCNCYEDAKPLCRRAVELSRAMFNAANDETSKRNLAQDLNTMAIVYENLRNLDMAAKYYRESMNLYEPSSSEQRVTNDERVNRNRKRLAEDTVQEHQQPIKKTNISDKSHETVSRCGPEEKQQTAETRECVGRFAHCICESCERLEDEERERVKLHLVLEGLPEMHKNEKVHYLREVVYAIGKFLNNPLKPSDIISVYRNGSEEKDSRGHRSVVIVFRTLYPRRSLFYQYIQKRNLMLSDIFPDTNIKSRLYLLEGLTTNDRKLVRRCTTLRKHNIISRFQTKHSRVYIQENSDSTLELATVDRIAALEAKLHK